MTEQLPSLTLVRRLRAAPAKVFSALTDPVLMVRWWGPDAGPTLSAYADVRPGGRYRVTFRCLDGKEYTPTGVYREVIPERKLVFTWELPGALEPDSLVTLLLKAIDGGTELTLIHERLPDVQSRASHELGWAGWMDKLATFIGDAA